MSASQRILKLTCYLMGHKAAVDSDAAPTGQCLLCGDEVES